MQSGFLCMIRDHTISGTEHCRSVSCYLALSSLSTSNACVSSSSVIRREAIEHVRQWPALRKRTASCLIGMRLSMQVRLPKCLQHLAHHACR